MFRIVSLKYQWVGIYTIRINRSRGHGSDVYNVNCRIGSWYKAENLLKPKRSTRSLVLVVHRHFVIHPICQLFSKAALTWMLLLFSRCKLSIYAWSNTSTDESLELPSVNETRFSISCTGKALFYRDCLKRLPNS